MMWKLFSHNSYQLRVAVQAEKSADDLIAFRVTT